MTSPGAEGPWTIAVCEKHGPISRRAWEWNTHANYGCPMRWVEVVDRRKADDLAEARFDAGYAQAIKDVVEALREPKAPMSAWPKWSVVADFVERRFSGKEGSDA